MKTTPAPQKRLRSKDGPTPAELRWRPIVQEWRQSGQEAAAFCRERHVPLPAFKFWKKELPLREKRRTIRLLPVRVIERVSASPAPVEIVLRGGRIVRVTGDFDPPVLLKLLGTLEEGR